MGEVFAFICQVVLSTVRVLWPEWYVHHEVSCAKFWRPTKVCGHATGVHLFCVWGACRGARRINDVRTSERAELALPLPLGNLEVLPVGSPV